MTAVPEDTWEVATAHCFFSFAFAFSFHRPYNDGVSDPA